MRTGDRAATTSSCARSAAAGAAAAPLAVALRKQIPVGAGLGGGSSDAAAILRAAIDGSARHRSPAQDWLAVARALGSDVPFFLTGTGALVEGTGERVTALGALPPWWVVVLAPDVHVDTGDAYRRLAAARSEVPAPVRPRAGSASVARARSGAARRLRRGDRGRDQRLRSADRRGVSRRWQPRCERCATPVPAHAMLSGSGGATFALCEREDAARALAAAVERSERARELFVVPLAAAAAWRGRRHERDRPRRRRPDAVSATRLPACLTKRSVAIGGHRARRTRRDRAARHARHRAHHRGRAAGGARVDAALAARRRTPRRRRAHGRQLGIGPRRCAAGRTRADRRVRSAGAHDRGGSPSSSPPRSSRSRRRLRDRRASACTWRAIPRCRTPGRRWSKAASAAADSSRSNRACCPRWTACSTALGAARKSPLRLAALFGWDILPRFAFGSLTVDAARTARERDPAVHRPARSVCSHPEVAVNVDRAVGRRARERLGGPREDAG